MPHRFFVRTILPVSAAAWLIAVGCSSDDSQEFPPGSDGGTGGAGATGGSGGAGADNAGGDGATGGAGGGMTAEEICDNGLDDDGDGQVDEGCPCELGTMQPCYGGDAELAGVGPCVLGQQACIPTQTADSMWGECFGWTPPSEEQCNAQDDDCDGVADEDLVHFCPEGGGMTTCTAGDWSPCEACNGTDDDGDGLFDEDLLRGCTDGCSELGFQTCESTTWTECTPTRTFDPTVDRGGIEVDSVTIAAEPATTTLTLSHDVSASLSDRLVLAGVALSSPTTITAITYGGAALTEVASWTADSGFEELRVEVFYLMNPPAGTADLTVTLAEAQEINVGVYTMGNVGDVPKLLGASKDNNTDPAYTANATPAGLVVDFIGKEANHEISPAPISELGWDFCGPGYARFGSSLRAADGPTDLYWEFSCCPDEWILGAVLVPPI